MRRIANAGIPPLSRIDTATRRISARLMLRAATARLPWLTFPARHSSLNTVH